MAKRTRFPRGDPDDDPSADEVAPAEAEGDGDGSDAEPEPPPLRVVDGGRAAKSHRISSHAASRASRSPAVQDAEESPGDDAGEADAADRDEEPDATQAGPPLSLLVAQGPDEGTTRRIRGARMIIGRSESCDFHLSDASVSRRHAEIVVGPRGAVLRDLGSGNGTRVNGKRATEVLLAHGDEISMGQTTFVFQDELEAAKAANAAAQVEPPGGVTEQNAVPEGADEDEAAEAPQTGTSRVAMSSIAPKTRLRLAVAGAAVVIAVVAAIAVFAPRRRPTAGASDEARQAAVRFERGKQLLGARQYKDALTEFKEVERLAPGTADLAAHIEAARGAADAERKIAAAKAYVAAEKFDDARALLKQIPESALIRLEDDTVVAKMLEQIASLEIDSLKKKIDERLDVGDIEGARPFIQRLPASLRADVERRIDEAVKRQDREQRDQEHRDREEQRKLHDVSTRRAQAQVDRIIAPAVRKIDSGDFDRAERELHRITEETADPAAKRKAAAVLKSLPTLADSYRNGTRLYENGSVAQSATPLHKALWHYESLDLDGTLDREIKPKLAQALYVRGKGRQAANEYGAASKDYRDALKVDPKHERSRAALREMGQLANEVFMDAYQARTRDPEYARKRFREVLQIVPPSDDAYQKAQRWLKTLEGGAVE